MKNKDKNTVTLKGSKVIGRILGYMKPYLPLLAVATLFTIICVIATLSAPVVIGMALDNILSPNNVDFNSLLFYIIILAVLLAIVFLFQWLAGIITSKISYLTVRDIRYEAFKKLNKVPIKFIDSNAHGDIMSRIINDADQISDGLIQGFTQLFAGIITIIGTVIFMINLNLTISLVVIILTPLSLAVAYIISKFSYKMFRNQAIERGNLSSLCNEYITNQKIVKAFSYEEQVEDKFAVINKKLKKYGSGSMFFASIAGPTARFINSAIYAVVCVMGSLLVLSSNGLFTIGLFSAFLAYANQYTKPFNEITNISAELQTAITSARRLFELLDAKEQKSDKEYDSINITKGNLTANSVYFSYDKSRTLITDFNIDIKSGSKVAIVGPTGCGKTTLINLLMRFYDADSGSICIDGQNIFDHTRRSLRLNYGMVLQDSWLFKGSVKDNIRYSKPDATDDEIIEACKKANTHGFIKRLENGYDTILESDGGNISQGQKQLLCIARIMLSAPPMLILDEATSNIDTRTEVRIQKAFNEIMQGRTSFIIAHRLSTIIDADVILVMDKGNIIESGTHLELLEKQGFYYNLFNSQFAE